MILFLFSVLWVTLIADWLSTKNGVAKGDRLRLTSCVTWRRHNLPCTALKAAIFQNYMYIMLLCIISWTSSDLQCRICVIITGLRAAIKVFSIVRV